MLFAKVLPGAQRACTFDIFADRSVWLLPALRSFAIVCDYMETALFAIVCDLRSAIRDRLRSSAIIWKPAFSPANEAPGMSSSVRITDSFTALLEDAILGGFSSDKTGISYNMNLLPAATKIFQTETSKAYQTSLSCIRT